jgi:hypothetical protein
LTELSEFTDRRNFRRAIGQQFKTIEIIYEPSNSKGITAIASANWSGHDSAYPIKNSVTLDADTLCEMVDYLLDNSYVAHTGIVYKQVIGMAMGVHNAPQMANLYCAHYELRYVLRRSVHYLTTLKLYESVPATPKYKMLRAEVVSIFKMCRLMNGIAVVGMPDTIDVAAMMRDECDIGGGDGICPAHITDSGGNVITNPMEVC